MFRSRSSASTSFALLVIADFVSSFGSSMSAIAIMLIIYGRTESLLLASCFSALMLIPRLILSPLVKKFRTSGSYRAIFCCCEIASAALFSILLLNDSIAILFIVCTLQCVPFFLAECFRADFLKRISDTTTVYRFQSISQVANTLVMVIAPVAGGALLSFTSNRWIYALDIASYLLAAVIISLMQGELRPSLTKGNSEQKYLSTNAWREAKELRAALLGSTGYIYWGMVLITAAGTIGSVVTVVYVRDILHRLDFYYTVLMSVSGIGATIGAGIVNIPAIRERIYGVASVGIIVVSLVMCSVLLRPGGVTLCALMFLSGVGSGSFTVFMSTQLLISFEQDEVLSRFAYFTTLTESTRVVSNPLAAGLEARLGPISSLVASGALMLGISPLVMKAAKRAATDSSTS